MYTSDLKRLNMDNLSNGGKAILSNVRLSYEYKNNMRTDRVNGLKVTVVFPANGYVKQAVTVADPTDRLSAVLDTVPAGTQICVEFQNLTVKVYRDRDGREQISAKADSVQIIDNMDNGLIEL